MESKVEIHNITEDIIKWTQSHGLDCTSNMNVESSSSSSQMNSEVSSQDLLGSCSAESSRFSHSAPVEEVLINQSTSFIHTVKYSFILASRMTVPNLLRYAPQVNTCVAMPSPVLPDFVNLLSVGAASTRNNRATFHKVQYFSYFSCWLLWNKKKLPKRGT